MPLWPHLDDVAGVFAGVVHRLGGPVRDTTAGLDAYRGLSMDALFPAPAEVPPVGVRRRWRLGGLESQDLRFGSLHEPVEPRFRDRYRREDPALRTVYARRVRGPRSAGRPRLLYIHGYMQPETYVEELVVLGAIATRLDLEVVQIQPPYHGRRRPRRSRFDGELFWTADLVRSVEALRQTVLDARTLLSWMLDQDPRPVGVAGLSLGGALSAALTCLEPRFHFSLPLIAHMDLAALLRDAPVLGRMRRELAATGFTPDDLAAFTHDLGWDALRPVVPAERIRLMAAEDDRFFDPAVVRAMWEHWGRPAIDWYPGSHMGFVAHVPSAMGTLRSFVDGVAAAPPTPLRAARSRDARR